MERTEETIKKWFTTIVRGLEAYGPPRTQIDHEIRPSVAVIENYLTSAYLLARHKRVLPAKALLRPVGEFTAKLKYCVAGAATGEIDQRVKAWRKSSWREYKRFWEGIRPDFRRPVQAKVVEDKIAEADEALAGMKDIPDFPKIGIILKHAFPEHEILNCHSLRAGAYSQHVIATHIDPVTLKKTINRESGTTEFTGDVLEGSIEWTEAELDVLCEAYLFVEAIMKYYDWDYTAMPGEFNALARQVGETREDN